MPKAKINGIEIYYEIHGDANSSKCVSFLNGVASSVNGWYGQIETFKKAGYKILLHDFRGQLLSDTPDEPYSFEQNAEDLLKLLDYLEIEKTHLIGISYGGIVAIRFASLFPEKVESLIGLNTMHKPDVMLKLKDKAFVSRYRDYNIANLRNFFEDFLPVSYSYQFLAQNLKYIEERLDSIEQLPLNFLKGQIKMCYNFINDNFDDAELKKITCPVMIVASENDYVAYLHYSIEILKYVPHAEYLIMPNCGHASTVEKPETVNSIITGFILKNDLLIK